MEGWLTHYTSLLSTSLFSDLSMFSLGGFLHNSWGSIGKDKEPTHVVTIIGTSDQMVIGPKDINYKLNYDEPKKLL